MSQPTVQVLCQVFVFVYLFHGAAPGPREGSIASACQAAVLSRGACGRIARVASHGVRVAQGFWAACKRARAGGAKLGAFYLS